MIDESVNHTTEVMGCKTLLTKREHYVRGTQVVRSMDMNVGWASSSIDLEMSVTNADSWAVVIRITRFICALM